MKINSKDLKILYSAHLIENTPPSRKNCPPTKEIINLIRLKLSKKRKAKIIDHVTECYFCYEEFQSILEILREENKLICAINELAIKGNEIPHNKKEIPKDLFPQRNKSIPFFQRLSWKFVSVSLAFILILSTISIFVLFLNRDQNDYRSEYYPSIRLIDPIGGKIQKTLLKFRWVEIEESEYYIIEIFDETLFPVWRSNKIYSNDFTPPEEIADRLKKNKRYFWMLTAYFPDGRKNESRIEQFILID